MRRENFTLLLFTCCSIFSISLCKVDELDNVVEDSQVAAFIANLTNLPQSELALLKTALQALMPGLTIPEDCVSGRCLKIFYDGFIIGGLTRNDIKRNMYSCFADRPVAVFHGYSEKGAKTLVESVVISDILNLILVPMPNEDGSRGTFGFKTVNRLPVDEDYEIIEKWVKANYPKIKFEPWIDAINATDLAKFGIDNKALETDVEKVEENSPQLTAWNALGTAFRNKFQDVVQGGEKPPRYIFDGFIGAEFAETSLAIMLFEYTNLIRKAQTPFPWVYCTETPAGYGPDGFWANWRLSKTKTIKAMNLVPNNINSAILKKSMLWGVLEGFTITNKNVDIESTKIPEVTIIAGNVSDYGRGFLSVPSLSTSILKPLDKSQVRVLGAVLADKSVIPYTLMQFTASRDK